MKLFKFDLQRVRYGIVLFSLTLVIVTVLVAVAGTDTIAGAASLVPSNADALHVVNIPTLPPTTTPTLTPTNTHTPTPTHTPTATPFQDLIYQGQVVDENGNPVPGYRYVQIWGVSASGTREAWLANLVSGSNGRFSWQAPTADRYAKYDLVLFPIDNWSNYQSISAIANNSGVVVASDWIRLTFTTNGIYAGNVFEIRFSPPTPTPTSTPSDEPQPCDNLVVNTADDVDDGVCSIQHCSFREAINAANNCEVSAQSINQVTVISFENLPGSTIDLTAPLPPFSGSVFLNGSSAPAGKVELNGSQAGQGDGIVLTGSGSTVQGMVINRFNGNGIVLQGGGNHKLLGNFIGTSRDGQSDLGNSGSGIYANGSSSNAIGGTTIGSSNLISGNGGPGILISNAANNEVLGNFVGVNVDGNVALGNGIGLRLSNAQDNTIGGAISGARNLISGNAGSGVELIGGGTTGNQLVGNSIGVNASAGAVLANETGILLDAASGNQIGGSAQGMGNTIAGNSAYGLLLTGGAGNNRIQGNNIGTNLSGDDLGQSLDGVRVENASNNNLVGGLNRGEGNTIAYNVGAGISVDGSTGNTIAGNIIYSNGTTGIANIAGGNLELTPPLLAEAAGDAVSGTAKPGTVVEVFGDDGEQGRYFLGRTISDEFGHFRLTGLIKGTEITATATDPAGNTSEFATAIPRQLDCEDTFETNDVWTQAYPIVAGQDYVSFICSASDVDFYKLPVALLESGSIVTFKLTGLSADFDLVLFRPTNIPTDLQANDLPLPHASTYDVPVKSLPLQNVPLQNVPLQNVPLQNVPLQNVPLQNVPLQNVPLQNVPLQNVPLQNVPLQNVPLQNVPLVGYSVQPGDTDEAITDVALYAVDHYYVAVVGHNGVYSTESYTLSVEVQSPPPPPACVRSFEFEGTPGELYAPWSAEETQTLILFPKRRLERLYGSAQVAPLVSNLQVLADHSTVKGLVFPLESEPSIQQAYDAWDGGLVCQPEAANEVSYQIKLLIAGLLQSHPNVQHLLIVGNDEAFPFRRIKDIVETSNESEYASQLLVEIDTAIFSAFSQGYMFSDDYYADMAPSPYRGRPLYVIDYGLGRLVETPAEMNAVVSQYLARQGVLNAGTGLAFGYDFLKDSTALIAGAFDTHGLNNTIVNNDTWSADDLRADFLGERHDLNSLNAHFSHYLLEPADRNLIGSGGLFTATDIISSTVDLTGTVNFSVGCHSGLNVCDVCTSDFGQQFNADLDFAQAFAQKQAVWIGNAGYGYGDDMAATLSEELMSNFAANVGTYPSIGHALRQAKQDYALLSMGAYGPYDEKALVVSTLYGIPTYQVIVPGPGLTSMSAAASVPDFTSISSVRPNETPVKSTLTFTPDFELVETPNGSYFSADSGYRSLFYNPIQPRAALNVSSTAEGEVAHGALLLEATYTDIADFDPVITMPVTETARYEPQFIYTGWQPQDLANVNHFETAQGLNERLILTLGQFLYTDTVDGEDDTHVIGIERRYDHLTYDVYYSDSSDFDAPIIMFVGAVYEATGEDVQQLRVTASIEDDSGVERAVMTYTNGTGSWQSLDLNYDGASNRWTGTLTDLKDTVLFMVQAVDGAGNVGLSAAKGELYGVASVNLSATPEAAEEGDEIDFTANAADSGLGEIQSSQWDFGDGFEALNTLEVTHRYQDNGDFLVGIAMQDEDQQVGSGTVIVPISNAAPVVETDQTPGGLMGQPITLDPITFTDKGALDTHTATIDWDDGSDLEPGLVVRDNQASSPLGMVGTVTFPSHTLAQEGVYKANICVRDDDGAETCIEVEIPIDPILDQRNWLPFYIQIQ